MTAAEELARDYSKTYFAITQEAGVVWDGGDPWEAMGEEQRGYITKSFQRMLDHGLIHPFAADTADETKPPTRQMQSLGTNADGSKIEPRGVRDPFEKSRPGSQHQQEV